jgi:integrase
VAYISKYRDKWRAQVERNGVRTSQTFRTKSEAIQWAQAVESDILSAKAGRLPKKTLRDAILRYKEDVCPKKKGERAENLRLDAFLRDFPHIADKIISQVKTSDMVEWRDARLKKVTPGSVQRHVNLLSNVFRVAWKEWQWTDNSPFTGMKAPGDNPPRERIIQPFEVRRIVRWLGYRTGERPQTKMQEAALAFMISLRTAMRASEVLSLGADNVDLKKRVARVAHKTQHLTGRPREVPLSRQAIRLLEPVMAQPIFTITSASLDATFRKAKANTQIEDLHFHDARASALTRFSKKVDVLTLAKISGHRDLKILQDHYYRVTAEEIARQLG